MAALRDPGWLISCPRGAGRLQAVAPRPWITDSCVSRLKAARHRYQQLYTPTFAGGLELAYGMLIDELWLPIQWSTSGRSTR